MRLARRQRRLAVAVLGVACIALIVWAAALAWHLPCRSGSSELPFNTEECPTLAEDLAPLVVALGLVALAAAVEFAGGQSAPLAFLLYAVVLASGKLALVGEGLGWRLYFLSLSLAAPATFALHARLVSGDGTRWSRLVVAVLTGVAVALAAPTALPPYVALSMPWYETWRAAVRGLAMLSVVLSGGLVAHAWRSNRPNVRRRPIRLIVYGDVAAFIPFVTLSLLPETLRLPVYVPYEVTLFGLLMAPLFYAFALSHARLERFGGWLQQFSVYYLLVTVVGVGLLIEAVVLGVYSGDAADQWLAATVVLSAILLVAMVPLRQALVSIANWVWNGRGPSYDLVAQRLAEALSVTLDVPSLQGLLVHDLGRELRVKGGALYLRQSDAVFGLIEAQGLPALAEIPALPASGALAAFLQQVNEPVDAPTLAVAMSHQALTPTERQAVELPEIGLWLPLVAGRGLHGLLILAAKQAEDVFTIEDLQFLGLLIHQAGVAAHNVLLMDEVRQSQAELARAHQQLLVVSEQEQRRLAHELHDGPVQQLIAITYQLAQGRRQLERNGHGPTETAESLGQVLDAARQQLLSVVTELRTAIAALRPAGLEELGLAAALTGYVARLERERQGGGPRFELEFGDDGAAMPLPLALCLFRVAQEAISNSVRHAGASTVRVRLEARPESVRLEVRDDGRGFTIPTRLSELTGRDHFGLVTITERVAQVGGRLELRSAPGAGTTVAVTVDREEVREPDDWRN